MERGQRKRETEGGERVREETGEMDEKKGEKLNPGVLCSMDRFISLKQPAALHRGTRSGTGFPVHSQLERFTNH